MILLLNSVTWFACFSRWDFGDGVQETYLFKPPYNKSFLVPDPSVHEVVIEHNVSHIYQDPGMLRMVLWGRKGSGIFVAWGLQGTFQLKKWLECNYFVPK